MTTPNQDRRRRRYPLHVYIAVLFTALVLGTGVLISAVDYGNARKLALDAVGDVFERSARETLAELRTGHEPIRTLVALLAQRPNTSAGGPAGQLASLPLIRRALDSAPVLTTLYVAFLDGGLFSIRRLDFAAARRAVGAPPDTSYLVEVSEAGRAASLRFYDEDLDLIGTHSEARQTHADFPWFRAALESGGLVRIPAFALGTQEIGFAVAEATQDRQAVVGADLALKDLSASLSRQRASPSAELALVDAAGRVLAASRGAWAAAGDHAPLRLPTLAELDLSVLAQAFAASPTGGDQRTLHLDGRAWEALTVASQLADGEPLYLVMAAPHDELLAGVTSLFAQALLSMIAVLLVAVPATWWIARRISRSLRDLSADARAIRRFRFDGRDVGSFVLEVDDLGRAMGAMRSTIRQFLDIASRLAAERHFQPLLDGLVAQTVAAGRADAGTVYLMDEAGAELRPVAWQHVELAQLSHPPGAIVATESDHPVGQTVASGRMHTDRLAATGFPQGLEWLGSRFPGQGVDCLAVPLRNRSGKTLGVLFLAKPANHGGFSPEQASFVDALSGTLAVAVDNQRLMQAQKALLDAVIRVMAGAIDAKSPYTGGHCQRVPELAIMLAEAACAAREGPFRDFDLDDDQWETLRIAAWLHDCGKLTTPEYVVDKATKLETLYDRIHEIRMRFEVLKRDAETAYWRGIAEGGEATALAAERDRELATLDTDFAFVAACNLGREQLPEAARARLTRLAGRTWRRTLDDSIGISTIEYRRKARTSAPALPIDEPLLADRQDHRILHESANPLPDDIQIKTPEYRLDLGELHSLSVSRGTLTAEERFLINNHIVQTILMLRSLPFPQHLKDVPEVAGNHHEHLDGSGYPRGLDASALSVPARMMAIADIFEALTASDRPYKPGKTLSESVELLADSVSAGHLDGALFELFLRAGVHDRFARRFLDPRQIDEVDLNAMLARARAPRRAFRG